MYFFVLLLLTLFKEFCWVDVLLEGCWEEALAAKVAAAPKSIGFRTLLDAFWGFLLSPIALSPELVLNWLLFEVVEADLMEGNRLLSSVAKKYQNE